MSLRVFHLVFLLIAIAGADMVGAWGVYDYVATHNIASLAVGCITFLGGFGLIGYAIWFVRKTEQLHLR